MKSFIRGSNGEVRCRLNQISELNFNKNGCKTKIKDMLSGFTKFKKLEIDENKQLNFYSTVRRNWKISLNPYIKKCLTKKKYDRLTKRDEDQEYFAAVLRYINLSLITVPPFGPFYLL